MRKLFVCLPALALAVALSGSALAENGTVSDATLQEMGLSGLEIMSDSDAMAIRGRGFADAWGNSSSEIEIKIDFRNPLFGGNVEFETSTDDGFNASGEYMAAGAHSSESFFDATYSNSDAVSGLGSFTTTLSLSIGIGSRGSASSAAL